MKLTKGLKKAIISGFTEDRLSVGRLATLYGLSPRQIENTLREAIRAEIAADKKMLIAQLDQLKKKIVEEPPRSSDQTADQLLEVKDGLQG